jgi:serine/threonine-protein kinase RsbW
MSSVTEKLTVHSQRDQLVTVRGFVADAARKFGFSEFDVNKIEIAIDEAATNVIRHAYGEDATKTFDVIVNANGDKFIVTLEDSGIHFDPKNHKLPNMTQYLSEHRRGGLGVKMIFMLMDEVSYNQNADRKNRLTLVKYLK